MARKILSWVLIIFGALFLLLSVSGIAAIWIYRPSLTRQATGRLQEIDSELAQAQTTLQNAETELERALRVVEAAEKALATLSKQSTDVKSILEDVKGSLNGEILPGLEMARQKIDSARSALESLRSLLQTLGPFVDLSLPDQTLKDLIEAANSLDSQIAGIQTVAQQASTFVSDTSYLLGGDFTETKAHLQELLATAQDYDQKVTAWRKQIAIWKTGLPGWINGASIVLTLILIWSGLSQFGLILHGLTLRGGGDPLAVLRAKQKAGTVA